MLNGHGERAEEVLINLPERITFEIERREEAQQFNERGVRKHGVIPRRASSYVASIPACSYPARRRSQSLGARAKTSETIFSSIFAPICKPCLAGRSATSVALSDNDFLAIATLQNLIVVISSQPDVSPENTFTKRGL